MLRFRHRRSIERLVIVASGAILVSVCAAGCASILGYDDLSPYPADASDAGSDSTRGDTGDATDATLGEASNEAASEASLEASDEASDAASDEVDETADAIDDETPVHAPDPDPDASLNSTGSPTYWYVVQHFYLGLEDSTGAVNRDAWRTIGLDLDDVCTSATDSEANVGTCRRVDGAPADVLTDGDGCRDNNFGSQLIQLLSFTSSSFEDDVNTAITSGASTWILRLDYVNPGPTDGYAPGSLYRASAMPSGTTPKFDGTDIRTVTPDSVNDGDIEQPIIIFSQGYVSGGVWVSGPPTDTNLDLPIKNGDLTLPINSFQMVVPLSDDRSHAAGSVMVGALPITEIQTVIGPVAANAGVCPGTSIYNSILAQIQLFPDVVIGAPDLQSNLATCDGISTGIGFDLAPIPAPTAVGPAPVQPTDPCDAGSEAGDEAGDDDGGS